MYISLFVCLAFLQASDLSRRWHYQIWFVQFQTRLYKQWVIQVRLALYINKGLASRLNLHSIQLSMTQPVIQSINHLNLSAFLLILNSNCKVLLITFSIQFIEKVVKKQVRNKVYMKLHTASGQHK